MEVVLCSSCGSANEPGRKFCGECGNALAQACPSCGAANSPTVKFCGECGTALTATAHPAPPEPTTPTAERRLVSVLFADLVGFTTLSESRDAEEVRELLTRYFDACRRLIELYGGSVLVDQMIPIGMYLKSVLLNLRITFSGCCQIFGFISDSTILV